MAGEARELELYIENDAQLYRSQEQPIQKNLITKMAKGIYSHSKAVKLYGYLVQNGAKKYAKEFSVGTDWHQMFPTSVRKEVAERFAKSFETEAKFGNYDHLLPKKYQGKFSGREGQVGNPARSIPRNKWINGAVMIDSRGNVKFKTTSLPRRSSNPGKEQFVVEWGSNVSFFDTLAAAKKFIARLRTRGLHYGRHILIRHVYADGRPSKVVFEKSY